jgi:hypothetical protein
MVGKINIAILGLVLLIMTGCSAESHELNMENKTAAQTEITRLTSLAANEEITAEDLNGLKAMLKEDPDAEHYVDELIAMVEFKEYEHVGHSLSFLSSYISTGKNTLCPAHELAHYYVLMRHGEVHDAEHALEEAEETYDEWEEKAREYSKQYPGTESFEAISKNIQNHFIDIKAGNTRATDSEIKYLTGKGSLCVEE